MINILLHNEWQLFSGDARVSRVYQRWCNTRDNRLLIAKLYEPDPHTDAMVISLLQGYVTAINLQLIRNSKMYLEGGWVYQLRHNQSRTPAEQKKWEELCQCPTTSDCMESLYGLLDHILTTNSKSLSLFTGSCMSAFRANRTHEWMKSLGHDLHMLFVRLTRRMFIKLQSQRKDVRTKCKAERADRVAEQKNKVQRSKTRFLFHMLRHENRVIYKTVEEWEAAAAVATTGMSDGPRKLKKLVGIIRLQVQALKCRFGLTRAQLPSYTCNKVPFEDVVIIETYKNLLLKFENNIIALNVKRNEYRKKINYRDEGDA